MNGCPSLGSQLPLSGVCCPVIALVKNVSLVVILGVVKVVLDVPFLSGNHGGRALAPPLFSYVRKA